MYYLTSDLGENTTGNFLSELEQHDYLHNIFPEPDDEDETDEDEEEEGQESDEPTIDDDVVHSPVPPKPGKPR